MEKRNRKKNLTDASTEVTKFTADLNTCGSFLRIYNSNHVGLFLGCCFDLFYFIGTYHAPKDLVSVL